MATTFSCFHAAPILSCASPKPGPTNHKPPPSSSLGSNWFTPLFGWSSDPAGYIMNKSETQIMGTGNLTQKADKDNMGGHGSTPRSKFGLGCFTEEKAKELRKKTVETSTFHDIMYHSAIASRLASDLKNR